MSLGSLRCENWWRKVTVPACLKTVFPLLSLGHQIIPSYSKSDFGTSQVIEAPSADFSQYWKEESWFTLFSSIFLLCTVFAAYYHVVFMLNRTGHAEALMKQLEYMGFPWDINCCNQDMRVSYGLHCDENGPHPPNLLLNHSCAHATAPFHLIHVFYASFPSHFWPWPSHSLTSSSIISFTPISIHKFITTRTHVSTLHDHIISSLHHTTHLPIPVTLFAAKSIHPFSHHFTPPSLHAYMGPIPITWMRGGGAFRRGHQWVLLWYSEGVRYACCLGFSYKINSSRVHPEVRDSWCNAIHWGLTRLNLRALLVNTPILTEDSLMGAYDKKNWILLHDADVRCVLWPRNPDDGGSIVRGLRISTMFTHHLRIVVVGREMLSGVSGMEDPWKSKTRSL